ncbi:Histone H1/H5 [Corchorus capsularis]|uniref:Histone H1/H5 n=1 Tax=Corchorus capsularis TaxID=210143 RepID=A0A1R3K6A5_COCAP|nr:Histone H1/H5 [Corchorus capsularis]
MKKKSSCRKAASSDPPFLKMISDAIATLKERTGSSQYVIAKFIEEKHKQLPSNFKKLLHVQIKTFVAFKLLSTSATAKKPSTAAESRNVA